jgi:hypothetical protein
MLFTLVRGRTIWTILYCLSVNSQWRFSMLFLMVKDFHWVQLLLYMGLRLAMSFHSGHSPVSASSRMGPMSLSFSRSVLKVAGSQPAVATAAIARIWLMSVLVLTLG